MLYQILELLIVAIELSVKCFEFRLNYLAVKFTQRIEYVFFCDR